MKLYIFEKIYKIKNFDKYLTKVEFIDFIDGNNIIEIMRN